MKLDPDCMRDILIETEKLPFNKRISLDELSVHLPQYDSDILAYTCLKLNQAELLEITKISSDFYTTVHSINGLTYQGHQFLANIYSDNVWNKTKEVLSKVGTTSASSITFVANQVITAFIKNFLGF